MELAEPVEDRHRHDCLMKLTFSTATSAGHKPHLVAYYFLFFSNLTVLPRPTTDPQLRHILVPMDGIYSEATIRTLLKSSITTMPKTAAGDGGSETGLLKRRFTNEIVNQGPTSSPPQKPNIQIEDQRAIRVLVRNFGSDVLLKISWR
jgi:hypothetical protein